MSKFREAITTIVRDRELKQNIYVLPWADEKLEITVISNTAITYLYFTVPEAKELKKAIGKVIKYLEERENRW